MMDYIIEYWWLYVVVIACGIVAGVAVYNFYKLPTPEQLNKVRQWLLWAVTMAEQELGSGTGRLKLRQVYDLFLVRFPWLAKIISFAQFSELVDDALEDMREMLYTNDAVKALVNGGDDNGG